MICLAGITVCLSGYHRDGCDTGAKMDTAPPLTIEIACQASTSLTVSNAS